jgi:TolB-like protein/Tfp pilus assembly protein PilF
VDVVESVRLIEENEETAVRRWRAMVDRISTQILPATDGRLVKSLGDGMLLEFAHVQPAISAAFTIQQACVEANREVPPTQQMLVRIGAHVSELIADDHDVYGRGVNLAARLTTVAGPGEIVVSAAVRDGLTATLDAEIEDLGDCYLKHLREPVRAYRLGPAGVRPLIDPGGGFLPSLAPSIAVIPFTAREADPVHDVVGEVLADEIINALSRTVDLKVISRLSTSPLRGRDTPPSEVGAVLGANYVLSGVYRVMGTGYMLTAELAEARSGHIVWSLNLKGSVAGILSGENEPVQRVVAELTAAIMVRELHRAQTQALPTLESYTLLMGAISLMHRLSSQDFDRARQMLEVLTDRTPRLAVPHAWLAEWHVLRVQQGWTDDPEADTRRALECSKRALDDDPECSLALAVDGFIHTNLLRRLDIGKERYERALEANPNDSLAWLLKGTMHAFKGEGEPAVAMTARARALSPLDPLRYFYDSLSATAALAAQDYAQAAELAHRSYRLNRKHASTLRALVISHWHLGQHDEARRMVKELLAIEPSFTVARFVGRSPSSGYWTGKVWSEALREAGVPA